MFPALNTVPLVAGILPSLEYEHSYYSLGTLCLVNQVLPLSPRCLEFHGMF